MPAFPPADTPAAFDALGRGDPRIAAAAAALCQTSGLGGARLIATGSLPVFEAGPNHVLKLYPPCYAVEAVHEARVLGLVGGALGGLVPAVAEAGEAGGWHYLLLTRVVGEPLDRLWPSLSGPDRLCLAAAAGRLLRSLHGIPAPPDLEPRPGWRAFVASQTDRCVERQRALGLGPPWLEQIPPFLASAGLAAAKERVLLHTEVMREHLFAARGPSGWRLTGLVDFEPAMVGAREYELASVGLFVTRGSGPALRALLAEYGLAEAELAFPLRRRLLAYTLVHRYGNLPRYLARLPVEGASTLEDLADRWWGMGEEEEIEGG